MRIDIPDLYFDGDSFVLYALDLGGRKRADVDKNFQEAVRAGVIIPFHLDEDCSYHVRLLVDENLRPDEATEWVGRIDWYLHLPNGKLVFEGGFDRNVSVDEDFVRVVDVPPGHYQVEVYTYFPNFNALRCLESIRNQEPIGSWFRRTRPDTEFPDWLKYLLVNDPEQDPAYEEAWEEFADTDNFDALEDRLDEEQGYVDLLIRLMPLSKPEALPALDDNLINSNGWFLPYLNARKPEICPMGLLLDSDNILTKAMPTNLGQNEKPSSVKTNEPNLDNRDDEMARILGGEEAVARQDDETFWAEVDASREAMLAGEVSPIAKARSTAQLIADLGSDSAFRRSDAVPALAERGQSVVPTLVDALSSTNAELQKGAAQVLQQIGGETAITALIAALPTANTQLRTHILPALGRLGDSRAYDSIIASLNDESNHVRLCAIDALEKLGDIRAMPILIEMLSDTNETRRDLAAKSLAKLDPVQATPHLISALADQNDNLRIHIVIVLINDVGEMAVGPILRALNETTTPGQRQSLASVLGEIGGERAVPVLTKLLDDTTKFRNQRVCDIAASALESIGTDEALAMVKQWQEAVA